MRLPLAVLDPACPLHDVAAAVARLRGTASGPPGATPANPKPPLASGGSGSSTGPGAGPVWRALASEAARALELLEGPRRVSPGGGGGGGAAPAAAVTPGGGGRRADGPPSGGVGAGDEPQPLYELFGIGVVPKGRSCGVRGGASQGQACCATGVGVLREC